MNSYISDIHSIVAYIFVISTAVFVGFCAYRTYKKMHFVDKQFKLMKISLISAHTQLLLGLFLWMTKGYLSMLTSDFGATMKVNTMRLFAVEHPLMNIIAVILITIGYGKIKRSKSEKNQNKHGLIYFGIAFLLVLSRIPWAQWLG